MEVRLAQHIFLDQGVAKLHTEHAISHIWVLGRDCQHQIISTGYEIGELGTITIDESALKEGNQRRGAVHEDFNSGNR